MLRNPIGMQRSAASAARPPCRWSEPTRRSGGAFVGARMRLSSPSPPRVGRDLPRGHAGLNGQIQPLAPASSVPILDRKCIALRCRRFRHLSFAPKALNWRTELMCSKCNDRGPVRILAREIKRTARRVRRYCWFHACRHGRVRYRFASSSCTNRRRFAEWAKGKGAPPLCSCARCRKAMPSRSTPDPFFDRARPARRSANPDQGRNCARPCLNA